MTAVRRLILLYGLLAVAACEKSPPAASPAQPSAPPATPKATFDLQDKCARDAYDWYKDAWGGPGIPGDDVTTHYNAKMGKCFVVLKSTIPAKHTAQFRQSLIDVLENRDVGVVAWFADTPPSECQVNGALCSSPSQWDALVRPYMEE